VNNAVDSLASIFAISVGASLPVLALAAFSEWRRRRLLSQQASSRRRFVPRPRPAASAEASRVSLAWLGASIGQQSLGDRTPEAAPQRCPHCHYEITEASFFCRRCGTRLFRP
jgi:hypothetical protein